MKVCLFSDLSKLGEKEDEETQDGSTAPKKAKKRKKRKKKHAVRHTEPATASQDSETGDGNTELCPSANKTEDKTTQDSGATQTESTPGAGEKTPSKKAKKAKRKRKRSSLPSMDIAEQPGDLVGWERDQS